MAAILSLLVILIVSILITRVATIALIHTGLSHQTAKFQSRSAFTGVGFATNESERIVNHPLRRRVLLIPRIAALFAGVLLLWFVASSTWWIDESPA